MSLSASLSNAMSGLTASSRAAEVVSSNVANAMTEGYARREINLAALSLGGAGKGVVVTGINRVVNQSLLADRRVAEAGVGDRDARTAFLQRLESTLGTSDSASSVLGRVAAFDSALIEASSRPESEARLSNVLVAAQSLASGINAASTDIQAARASADDQIETEVATLNAGLARIAELNVQIRAQFGVSRDATALMDQRQQLVDQLASIVPLREVDRGHNQIALYTTGGIQLLDGRAAVIEFTPVGVVTPDMTLASGSLSGLTLNGRSLPTSGAASMIGGGSLAAHFAVRDELAPAAQTKLDAVARDLVERFADPAIDTTRAPGDPGLFTDAGSAFVATDEVGLSQRLALNGAVDPAQGGALWRLRDGMGAVAPGLSGNSALLSSLQTALAAPRAPVSGGFMPGARSFSSLNADVISGVSTARLGAEAESSFATARATALQQQELENGVDTDQEMQKLLLIEQAYSANARVIQTAGDMIDILMGI
ncbi:flagellar hook-associated protein FlgK [Rhodobacter ferrooxidans]|uniref:Flagellar hook-associated protein 1 n=1 Tax=Rhodobacter ferrooxidans TaxID=371731 RepID=C8RX44_9RHOB|nr:flagellar hook-associated protein FlgK [Rhodobacter sp. SW2]EEW26569.1 flagellar hook-associated protein FlgK [Rhodobacter sp. SW2]